MLPPLVCWCCCCNPIMLCQWCCWLSLPSLSVYCWFFDFIMMHDITVHCAVANSDADCTAAWSLLLLPVDCWFICFKKNFAFAHSYLCCWCWHSRYCHCSMLSLPADCWISTYCQILLPLPLLLLLHLPLVCHCILNNFHFCWCIADCLLQCFPMLTLMLTDVVIVAFATAGWLLHLKFCHFSLFCCSSH